MAWCRRAALLDEPIILNSLVGKVVRLLFEGVSARSISKKLSLPYDGVLRVARACRILLKRGRPGRWKGGALKGGLDTKRSAEIERLTEKGYTLAEIGARFGISRERVRQVLLSLGRKSIARDVRWERRMRRLERLSQRGLTLSEAANRLGLARATVVAEARLQGLVFAPERRKRPPPDPRMMKVKALYEAGKTVPEIMRLEDASYSSVYAWLRRLGVPLRDSRPGRKSLLTEQRETLMRRLWREGAPYCQIAERLGVSVGTVSVWRSRLKLPYKLTPKLRVAEIRGRE